MNAKVLLGYKFSRFLFITVLNCFVLNMNLPSLKIPDGEILQGL